MLRYFHARLILISKKQGSAMNGQERKEILEKVKTWFRAVIIPNHIKNTQKLSNPSEFDINPFLTPYIAAFLTGELTPESVAKALLYPRILGSSITTSFGQNMQTFISEVLDFYGSLVPGIDIEFVDALDGRKKYCQAKLGPNTINKDDVETIHNHFRQAKNLGKTNNLPVQQHDLVVGILYGESGQESNHYKKLRDKHDYSLHIGKDFWHRLTGDESFYAALTKAIAEVAVEAKGEELIGAVILELSQTDEIKKLAGK
jgi:Type II restriction endonuclease EcoO109I